MGRPTWITWCSHHIRFVHWFCHRVMEWRWDCWANSSGIKKGFLLLILIKVHLPQAGFHQRVQSINILKCRQYSIHYRTCEMYILGKFPINKIWEVNDVSVYSYRNKGFSQWDGDSLTLTFTWDPGMAAALTTQTCVKKHVPIFTPHLLLHPHLLWMR